MTKRHPHFCTCDACLGPGVKLWQLKPKRRPKATPKAPPEETGDANRR